MSARQHIYIYINLLVHFFTLTREDQTYTYTYTYQGGSNLHAGRAAERWEYLFACFSFWSKFIASQTGISCGWPSSHCNSVQKDFQLFPLRQIHRLRGSNVKGWRHHAGIQCIILHPNVYSSHGKESKIYPISTQCFTNCVGKLFRDQDFTARW